MCNIKQVITGKVYNLPPNVCGFCTNANSCNATGCNFLEVVECYIGPSGDDYRDTMYESFDYGCDVCGGACFLPGTQVATPQGDKSIETLKPGDAVFSFNELTGKRVLNTVQNSPVRTVQEYYIIKTQSGREVKTTAEHPFLAKVPNRRDAGAGTSGKLEALGDLVRLIKSKLAGMAGGLN